MAPKSTPASNDQAARACLPLTPIAVHILLALADRDRHGLGIAEHIEEFTNGSVSPGPGTLYGTMKRLLELDLVEDVDEGPRDDHSDPRRRYYRVTPTGRRALELQTREMANILDVARLKRVIR
jgi:DNA-binding PadR family transcriptional regulator